MKQVPTGIPGLDRILDSGFTRPSTVLIAGTAGTGKTTFAIQSLFDAAKNGETCLYFSAISEPIAMLSGYMSNFSFYDQSLYEEGNLIYFDLSQEIMKNKTYDLLDIIEENVEAIQPDRIAIDPITTMDLPLDESDRRQFYFDLFVGMKGWNSLVLVTGEFTETSISTSPISYVADAIIYLSNEPRRGRRVRYLDILKMRGQDYASGKHVYRITKSGITTYPSPITAIDGNGVAARKRVSTGITGLDRMLHDGLIHGTTTLITGPSGTGKTTACTQFILDGARSHEPGLIVSFEENEAELRRNALSFGWDLKSLEDDSMLHILHPKDDEVYVSENLLQIRDRVEEFDVKRVVVDSINTGFADILPGANDSEYVYKLSRYLKSKNITTVLVSETRDLLGSKRIAENGTSQVMDTVVMLRYVEIASELRRAISVLKMRGSAHDTRIHEIEINDGGITIETDEMSFKNYEGVFSGVPRLTGEEAFDVAFGTG
ncbi:MAG: ATPase domain-containing protein [Euryarchaeota archaeon]|nr:MAG: Circadian clock protein kinase KaiC [ANME-2 cluster archaeon]MEA1863950.1 ATPase domain-containing protein [Euryarchaeota archaeon]